MDAKASPATYDKLTSVLPLVFDTDNFVATPTLSAREMEGLNSLAKVRLFIERDRQTQNGWTTRRSH